MEDGDGRVARNEALLEEHVDGDTLAVSAWP